MAKKPSKRRRNPAPKKRREHVEAQGAFAGTAFQSTGFQTDDAIIAAQQRRARAAVDASSGVFQSPFPPLAPLTIAPTPYPDDPAAGLPVQGYLRVDPASRAFKEFSRKLDQIFHELRKSNIIAGETRDRVLAELEAGRTLLAAPKPDRNLIELLLVTPLRYLAAAAVGAVLSELAQQALAYLMEAISHAPQIPM